MGQMQKGDGLLKGQLITIGSVLLAAFLGAAGQYLFREAAVRSGPGRLAFVLSPWIWVGIGCYFAVMLLFTGAFRRGGTVSMLYPLYASTFIWAAFMGAMFYGHAIRPVHVVGMLLLVAGMYLMGVGQMGADGATP